MCLVTMRLTCDRGGMDQLPFDSILIIFSFTSEHHVNHKIHPEDDK